MISTARTLDQAKVVMALVDAIADKSQKSTVSISAGRGRGKSASVGLAIAGAVQLGYSNIFVTAPSPDNLKTLFEFVCIGLELLDFKDRQDYERVYSNNKEYERAVLRIDVFKRHTQFVQFVFPNDADKIGHCDLVVVDEAAAIPLPYVKAFFGAHNLFLASTINGYEGTGRSLSLKLLEEIRQKSARGN